MNSDHTRWDLDCAKQPGHPAILWHELCTSMIHRKYHMKSANLSHAWSPTCMDTAAPPPTDNSDHWTVHDLRKLVIQRNGTTLASALQEWKSSQSQPYMRLCVCAGFSCCARRHFLRNRDCKDADRFFENNVFWQGNISENNWIAYLDIPDFKAIWWNHIFSTLTCSSQHTKPTNIVDLWRVEKGTRTHVAM